MGKKMSELHQEMMRGDPEYREAYEEFDEEFNLASAMIQARKGAGLTQEDVAKRMGISQPAVAKLESGGGVNVKTLQRYAKATGTRLHVSFEGM